MPQTMPLIPFPNDVELQNGSLQHTGKFHFVCFPPDNRLSRFLNPPKQYPEFSSDSGSDNSIPIDIHLTDQISVSGEESYEVEINPHDIILRAAFPAGLFYGIQTLRQIIQGAKQKISAMVIHDSPRYEWRGLMVDVARHFFKVEDIKAIIDQLATFKFNRLHLHLTDDQGWRIEIPSWPDLTRIGSKSAVNGDPGGYYTRADLEEIIHYAKERFIEVVPEIDMPGHTQAALASYPILNPDGKPIELYTGIEVGFSSLDPYKEITYQFIADVISEVSSIFPSPWIHIGGDEAASTAPEAYIQFIQRVEQIIHQNGKIMIGWEEIGKDLPAEGSVCQSWKVEDKTIPPAGCSVILSPANHVYLDMKYDETAPLGLQWAGFVPLEKSYRWDPATEIPGVQPDSILGVEACIFSETLTTRQEQEWMLYPRLLAVAETAWTHQEKRNWQDFRSRLEKLQGWITSLGINTGPMPEVSD